MSALAISRKSRNALARSCVFARFVVVNPLRLPADPSVVTDTSTAGYAKTPLLVTAIFTVVLLEIHPFQDGNGRLSRILMTLLLLSAGYSYLPYSSLESVIEQSKEGYYLALRQT
jgi:prophage maintenance system killer protein